MVGIFVDHPRYSDQLCERDPDIPLRGILEDRRNRFVDDERQYDWRLNYILVRSEN